MSKYKRVNMKIITNLEQLLHFPCEGNRLLYNVTSYKILALLIASQYLLVMTYSVPDWLLIPRAVL